MVRAGFQERTLSPETMTSMLENEQAIKTQILFAREELQVRPAVTERERERER